MIFGETNPFRVAVWILIDSSSSPLLGRIRNKAEVDEAAVDAILSLNIISAKYLKSSHSSNR